ncbi:MULTISPECIES: hypothetical protein [unclassified Bradyrhizobium]|uniref:hypothetical protein n=1 Tax=unclassified Bradyrhizobium TaxID=2631580 RepID=UPI002915D191|nr:MULTISPECIES: hypothetical protein [unclassified Bradyrhizobium]
MTLRSGAPFSSLQYSAVTASILVALWLIGAGAAWAQSQPSLGLREPPPATPAPPNAGEAPAHSDGSGIVDELGKLFEKMSILPLKSAGETGGDKNAAPAEPAKDAASIPGKDGDGETVKDALKQSGETLSRLAKPSSMVSGRSVCPLAANGTPDCKLGANKLCQGKGYKEGKSLNTDAAESCSAKVLIPGRQRKPGDCRTDTYVTSALCQ